MPWKGTLTTSAGTAAITLPFVDGILSHVFIQPATSTTTYDVKLTDIHSLDVFLETDVTNVLSDTTQMPIFGNMTLTIENASADEMFNYLIVSRER